MRPLTEQIPKALIPVLRTVFANQGRWDTSNVIDGVGVVHLSDKHHRTRPGEDFGYIDYGLLGLRRAVIEAEVPAAGTADLAELLFTLSRRDDLAGLEV